MGKIMNIKYKKYKTLLMLCFIFSNVIFLKETKANILPSAIIVDFKPDDPRQKNIQIYNSSDEVTYMDISIKEVLNPGTLMEKKVELKGEDKRKLIVTPDKTTLKSKRKKVIRFISTEKNLSKDKIYRVALVPKVRGVKGEKGAIGIKVLVGYEVLVVIRASVPRFDIKSNRKSNTLIFKNDGNTNVLLNKVVQCNKKNEACKTLLHKRLYAGNELKIPLPYGKTPVICEIYYADKPKKEVF